jgi:hypothetical protein
MRLLPPLAAAALLAFAAPAAGAGFDAPRTIADWGPGAEFLEAAPGAAAWTHPSGVRVWRDGQGAVRVPGEGLVQDLAIASDGGTPVAAWADTEMRLHAHAGHDAIVEGTMANVRKVAATPTAVAWIGVSDDDVRRLQLSLRRPGGAFTRALTPEQSGDPAFDVAAAGAGGRSLLAWPAHDGSTRRIELLTLDPSGTVSEPRWLTGTERGATSPAVAMAADGTGLVAWVDGMPNGIVTAAAVTPDGAAGPAQPLDSEPGGSPRVAVGPGGAAVAAWPSGGELRAALRRPGAERFSPAVALPSANVYGWTEAITRRGETVVAWVDAPPSASGRDGGRLRAAVAPSGGSLGEPVALADDVLRVDGASDALVWTEGRPDGPYLLERRVRTSSLQPEPDRSRGGGPPVAGADRRAPRLRLRVLSARAGRVRVRVRTDERATLRATWRRAGRVARRARGAVRAGRPRLLRLRVPAGTRKVKLTVRVTDRAGNARTARRTIRLRRAA